MSPLLGQQHPSNNDNNNETLVEKSPQADRAEQRALRKRIPESQPPGNAKDICSAANPKKKNQSITDSMRILHVKKPLTRSKKLEDNVRMNAQKRRSVPGNLRHQKKTKKT